MSTLNLSDWYWKIVDREGVLSTSRAGYVSETDPDYLAWRAAGNVAPAVATEQEVIDYLADRAPSIILNTAAGLLAYAKAARWRRETGGVDVGGILIATDDRSKQMLIGARIAAGADPSFSTKWAAADGTVTTLDAAQMIAISNAVLAHVSDCFARFDRVQAQIIVGTITTTEPIDSAFA